MELASSTINSGMCSATTRNMNTLPSLFGDHSVNGGVDSTSSSTDLDGLIAMNDRALSQQIEFILQDAPMEQDDIKNNMMTENTTVINNNRKLENPPNTIITSASAYNGATEATILAQAQSAQLLNHLNDRRIIIEPRQVVTIKEEMDDIEDPELNDENLQDIAEEAQAAEADEEPPHLLTHIKLEQPDSNEVPEEMDFVNTTTITPHHMPLVTQSAQLMLPTGSVVSTSNRAVTIPVSEAFAHLQRRPIYVSNTVGGMSGAMFTRTPAVISRNPMTVLNVVQTVPVGGTTTQVVLQETPVSNSRVPTAVVNSSNTAITSTNSTTAAMPIIETAVATSSTAIVAASSTTPSLPSTSNAFLNTNLAPQQNSTAMPPASATATTSTPTSTEAYQCLECVERFDTKDLYDIHRSGHTNNMKCAICNMVLKSLKNYEKHCLRCKPYECLICGRVVRFRPNFIKHMRVHTGQQSERHKYKCDVCQKEFMSFEYFKVHKKIHNENVNLTCEICGKVFSALASLRGHSKLHSGVKLHKCEVCGKGFGQRYNLKIHARTHTGDFPFECKICNKKLHTQSSLHTHMQVHQRDQTSQVTTTIKYEQTTPTKPVSSKSKSRATTIVKLESKSNYDGPSTSGLQNRQHNDLDNNTGMREFVHAPPIVTTTTTGEGSSSNESSNSSQEMQHEQNEQQEQQQVQQQQQELKQEQQQQLSTLLCTPTRTTIIFKNHMQDDAIMDVPTGLVQQQHAQVIQGAGINSSLQQQLLRKTPIIHSTGGPTTLSSALVNAVQQAGVSPIHSPSSSSTSTSCSSSVVVSKTLSFASIGVGTSTINAQNHNTNSISTNNHELSHNNLRSDHRNNHTADMDEDDNAHDPNMHRAINGRHFVDDDEETSPSLATAAVIKTEPIFYSSGSCDNSNEMFIKKEVMFEDSAPPHSPHSPPISKYRVSNFDTVDLVDQHVDLTHILPSYGNLFETHSVPDSIPTQLYLDDDDDFRMVPNSLVAPQNTSSSTNDTDFIKKEWVYETSSNYTMNGKFDDDTAELCDAANFIYN